MKPPYKSSNNVWFSRALFYDQVMNSPLDSRMDFKPPFVLYEDKEGYINARKTFVELGDPTGYKWAMRYLGDYNHWKYLMKAKWFSEAYEEWMHELKQKMRAEAIDKIRDIAEEGQPAQALVANKYLASFEWEKGSRGRPSKEEVQGELKKAAKILEVENDDLARIGLKVVK